MIDSSDWQRLSALLDEALALDEPARAGWLQRLSDRDPLLAGRVRRALAQDDPAPAGFSQMLAPALQLPTADAPQNLAGLRLGAWELQARIGRGGMGEVWRARRADGLYEAEVAIKLLRHDLSVEQWSARFARERAVLARLNHPAIARLLDAGVERHDAGVEPHHASMQADSAAGRAFLVLELVEGQNLSAHVRAHALGVAGRVQLLLRIAEAVDYAHARLVVHRDLKPSNVMVTPDGQPKLLDFGIAGLLDGGEPVDTELTRQTGRGLTLGYAAPEQITGEPIGTAADVFSLGVMLFELLDGGLPLGQRQDKRAAAERAVLHDEPRRVGDKAAAGHADDDSGPGRPPDVELARGDLAAVVAKALRKDPAQRYGSMRALIDDLQRWLAHAPVSVRRDDWRHLGRLWLRRNALAAGAAGLLVLTLAVGLTASLWQWQRAQAAARQSERVSSYLASMLAQASPDQHGGQWPDVLALLEQSRKDLPLAFADDPDTRLRMMGMLTRTYTDLNRFDRALPIAEEWVALASEHTGPASPASLMARLGQGRAHQVLGDNARAVALLEPMRDTLPEAFGPDSEEVLALRSYLAAVYMHLGRLDEAERELADAGRLTQLLHPHSQRERAEHLNNLHVLRNRQGRVPEALAISRQARPFWASTDARDAKTILVLRRNLLDTELELGIFDAVEARSRELVLDMDRVLGPGNELAALQYRMLARYFLLINQPDRAAAEYAALLERARADGTQDSPTMQRPRAESLLNRVRSRRESSQVLRDETAAQLVALTQAGQSPATGRSDALVVLTDVALSLDDAALAASGLAELRRVLGSAPPPGTAGARVEGELARLQGDLPRSRDLLASRVARYARFTEPRLIWHWSAQLDLAYTQVLMGDPAAAQTLDRAQACRPEAIPREHALDAVAAYLRARLAHGSDEAPQVREALAALARAQGRPGGWPTGAGRGNLGGAFF